MEETRNTHLSTSELANIIFKSVPYLATDKISFEERTFEGIAAKFEYFVQRVDNLCRRHGEKKIDEWMDNHDVCRKLRISQRTLQTLRDNGTLAFSKIGNKTYYRPEDVERIIRIVEDRRKEAKWRGRTI